MIKMETARLIMISGLTLWNLVNIASTFVTSYCIDRESYIDTLHSLTAEMILIGSGAGSQNWRH